MRDRAKQDEGFMVDKASLRHMELFVSSCKKIETLFNGTVLSVDEAVNTHHLGL